MERREKELLESINNKLDNIYVVELMIGIWTIFIFGVLCLMLGSL